MNYYGDHRHLNIIFCHVMGSAAFVAYPLAFFVYSNGIKPAQNIAAFSAYAYYSPEAVTAEK